MARKPMKTRTEFGESLVGAGKGAEGDLLAKLFPEIASTAVQGVELKKLTRILSHGGPSTS